MSPPPRSRHDRVFRVATGVTAAVASVAVLTAWLLEKAWIGAPTTVITFVLFVAVGELLEIPLERREPFTLAIAPALAFGLLRHCVESGGAWTCRPAPHIGQVLFVFLVGTLAATMLRAIRGNDLRLSRLASGTLVILAAGGAYQGLLALAPRAFMLGKSQLSLIGLVVVLFVVMALEIGLESAEDVLTHRRRVGRAVRDQSRAIGPLLLSSVSVGALLSLAYPALEAWTFPLFLAPLAATQFSFRQVATIRQNYVQTISALSKVPEMAGYTVRGHSSRVARLAIDVGTELGASDPELHEIEYAALLHDIGRISLPDPEDAKESTAGLELALVGAEIVENTGHFPRVAQMVGRQHEPYRRRGEDANETLPLGAKIIKVASAFDDLTEPGGPGRTSWDALERMHLGMAYDYDPKVIQALTRVLERRGSV
jgi:putative nucleotidyltransferase with HDIG domain